jgi:hypothetical protein
VNASKKSKQRFPTGRWLAAGVVVTIAVLAYLNLGLYTIQPIGALPEGGTAIVWRHSGEPFFNSADALCLERMGGVSLMCRGMAMGQAPTERILLRLPYMRWAYLMSTDGREFDR